MDIEVTYDGYPEGDSRSLCVGDKVIPNRNCHIFSEFPYDKLIDAGGTVTKVCPIQALPITIKWDHSDFGLVNHSPYELIRVEEESILWAN